MKKLLLLPLFLLFLSDLHATHIVGGEMNYTCLGDDMYEITLTIFRDCYNGSPNAYFDDPASIGIFSGATNALLFDVLVPFDPMINDTLDPVLSSICLVVPPDVCVHTTTYTTVVELPPVIGGYTLAYQRCCRNMTISNIIGPLDTGATYEVFISETALLECNSNPKFNTWPPVYICVNEPIYFDQSAFDVDGDSIVYKLCTPLKGADPGNPMPQPPNAPPYQPIDWINPPYNVANMLNGSPGGVPLTIDPETGLLEGLPNTIGQFVVGICVEEYRDGVLISTTRRDFQYNVGVCGETTSAFLAPEVQCGDYNVSFINDSFNADDYLWDFGDPANPGPNSTAINPSYTYPEPGLYTITLIVEPNTICADTFSTEVLLNENTLVPDFEYEYTECSDSLVIQLNDLSTDPVSTPVAWEWELSTGASGTGMDTVLVVYNSQEVIITLNVLAENGCESTIMDTIQVQLIEEELPVDTLIICLGDSIPLNPVFDPAYTFEWGPAIGLSDVNDPNPTAYPSETTTYSVAISDGTGCQIFRDITVFVPPVLEGIFPNDTTICSPDFLLFATSDLATEYYWASDPDFNDIFATTSEVYVTPFGDTTYYALLRDQYGCALFDSVHLVGNGVNVALDSFSYVCLGDSLQFTVTNLDLTDNLTYDWSPDSIILSGDGTNSVWVQPTAPGDQFLLVELSNQFGCTWADSLQMAVLDTLHDADFLYFTQCSGYSVNFFNDSPDSEYFIWHFGDPTNPTATATGDAPTYIYPAEGLYTVMLTLSPDIPCPDTLLFDILVEPPSINVDFGFEYESCADTVVIQFYDESVNAQSNVTGIYWEFSNGDNATISDPSITLYNSQLLEATLILSSDDGCVDTLTQSIQIDLIEVDIEDTLLICNHIPVPLNPGFDPIYQYNWAPGTGLDDPDSPNPLANPDETTTYTAEVMSISPDTCLITASVTVVIPPDISFMANADGATCDAEYLLAANSTQALDFAWSLDPDFTSIFSMDPEVLVEPPYGETSYYLQATDENGCMVFDTVLVQQYGIALDYNDQTTICIFDTILLPVTNLLPDQILAFQWEPDPEILEGQGTSEVLVAPQVTSSYDFTVTNQYGCEESGTIDVNIFNFVPPLDVFADPDTIVAGQESQLIATEDPLYVYQWVPVGSLSDPNIFNPIATPSTTTTYNLVITNADGCRNFAEVRVVVIVPICDHPNIFVPTGFSPNNDGHNDVYQVRGNYIDDFHLLIYDRWGEKVFESSDPNIGWDGTYKGKKLGPDVFAYYVELTCLGGDTFIDKGNLTLIR
ncbi:MAG: gliding motility-associated C-terminal domain-containing protein [Saprospiraceae bacterium]|nr:gliding motility-associated C-terminal domain-containing protein [Saprospiraceae bacterium]